MEKDAKIFVAGHRGLVGSAIVRRLQHEGYTNLALRTRSELDLLNQKGAENFFESERPEYVFLAAARVGGIHPNSTYTADFIYENLEIQNNIIINAYRQKVKKLLFLGSSCIYPKDCPQPMKEEYLLTGPPEPTNESYAIAKIAGIKMCQGFNKQYGTNFISVMPTNLYGPGDNFDLENAHVLPALIRKFVEAKENNEPSVVIWGSGTPRREFLYVDDLAEAVVYLMNTYSGSKILNIGVGSDSTIHDLALLIKKIVGYEGELRQDPTKPDGMKQKLLDITRVSRAGWRAKTSLEDGIRQTVEWLRTHPTSL